ncbi:MAG: hypothetical protein ACP5PT_01655 [Brevinematia bacterium]
MNSRYKKTNIFGDWPIVEIGFIVIIFLLSLGILFIPKDILYKLSILPFISILY